MLITIKNLLVIVISTLWFFIASSNNNTGLFETGILSLHHHHHRHHRHHKKHHNCHKGNHISVRKHKQVFNVDAFGAKGDGITDDSKAFKRAWNKFCQSREGILLIPRKRTYLLSPMHFNGPCHPNLNLNLHGTIKASGNKDDYRKDREHWLKFNNLRNFAVKGGGVVDGNGHIWWKESCKVKTTETCDRGTTPFAMTFQNGINISVKGLLFRNSQRMHLVFSNSQMVRASNLVIKAPGDSPNTDGIHVSRTTNVVISDSFIGTGDDCISIVNGSTNVKILRVVCGPGHGISIGSLGKHENLEEHVTNVDVKTVLLKGTTNGVRIKTWQGGKGSARNIKFENVEMQNVTNPIIIDQYYCDKPRDKIGDNLPCIEKEQAVQVSDVVYRNIRGTSAKEVAIKLECSEMVPCRGILLQNVHLMRERAGVVKAKCSNVKYETKGSVFPRCQHTYTSHSPLL
ncbi:unnamed protein product [Cuscuta europaea]|uniref:endo-polygalacturonase n=1 Tax=Cuscuta europaea TaxID=41803 RepID=A0A9P0Z9N9_CUSEU|nr:unnamed protein product [Cuscuta europaea]